MNPYLPLLLIALSLAVGLWIALRRAKRSLAELRGRLAASAQAAAAEREALHESRERLRALVEALPDVVQFKDGEGRWQEANRAGLRLFGLEGLPWRGKTEAELAAMQPELAEAYATCQLSDEIAWGGKGPLQTEERMGAGSWERIFDVTKVPLRDEAGGRRGLVILGREVTGQRAAEGELRKLSRAVEQSHSTIIITDPEGVIEFVNPAFERITGFSAADAVGANPRLLKSGHHPPEFYREMWQSLTAGRVWRGEMVNRRRDGTLFWELATISPIRNEAGRIVNFLAVKEEITARKQAESELVRAREAAEAANRAKGAFLANMSHELRTPLNGILGYAQILLADGGLTDRQFQGLSVIQQSGRHLLTLINDVLDLSRIEAGRLTLNPAPMALAGFLAGVADMVRMQAQEKGLGFRLEMAEPLPGSVLADERRLRQVLLNLLGNAVKFTAAGAVVFRVSCRPEPGGSAEAVPSVWLRFEVEDSGPGISEMDMGHLFVPFEQVGEEPRRGRGAGLGLAISRELVAGMGGEIRVESREGQGSRFHFEIPVACGSGTALSREPGPRILGCAVPGRRILVVDDVESNRLLIAHMLLPLGFEVLTAADGPQALLLAREGAPQLVLMDLRMEGMDGYEALAEMRRGGAMATVPVIAMTASVSAAERRQVEAAGFDGFLPKPVEREELLELLCRHLGIQWRREEAPPKPPAGAPVAPPPELLRELAGLARLGQVRRIQEWVVELERREPNYAPFARQVQQLLAGFDMRGIRVLAESQVAEGSAAHLN